jgi:hypothetical protein
MDLPVALQAFIQSCCELYSIDESHGLLHAQNTVKWTVKLMADEQVEVSPAEERMTIYGAALHDMCDAKYTDVQAAGAHIYTWLLCQNWTESDATALIAIIQSTSYSKLKNILAVKPLQENPGYPDHGQWQRVYHLIRHADLLEGYNVRRCMLYTLHSQPGKSMDEYWRLVTAVFQTRVLRYVSDGWIFLPKARIYAEALDQEARQALDQRIY